MVSRVNIVGYDCGVEYDPDGYYVRYSDYAALEAQLAARTGGVAVEAILHHLKIIEDEANRVSDPVAKNNLIYEIERIRFVLSALSPAPEAQQEPVACTMTDIHQAIEMMEKAKSILDDKLDTERSHLLYLIDTHPISDELTVAENIVEYLEGAIDQLSDAIGQAKEVEA